MWLLNNYEKGIENDDIKWSLPPTQCTRTRVFYANARNTVISSQCIFTAPASHWYLSRDVRKILHFEDVNTSTEILENMRNTTSYTKSMHFSRSLQLLKEDYHPVWDTGQPSRSRLKTRAESNVKLEELTGTRQWLCPIWTALSDVMLIN